MSDSLSIIINENVSDSEFALSVIACAKKNIFLDRRPGPVQARFWLAWVEVPSLATCLAGDPLARWQHS